ncbi:MAG: polymer-forming cytoskeletal protein [Acidobacteriota bacterium]|nr:polymer-forming cytoskeletal protein [Acidobacteriota bacterium]
MDPRKAHIGPSIQIKGELIGNEDLVIEGKVEGVVRLKDHHLTIGNQASIRATLEAKAIRVEGKVLGDVVANEKVELASGSTLLGDIVSPRIVISDGARFKGSVDMENKSAPAAAKSATAAPVAAKTAAPAAQANVVRKPAGVSS